MTFKELNFHPDIQEGLDAMYFEKPTPVQELAIPVIMKEYRTYPAVAKHI